MQSLANAAIPVRCEAPAATICSKKDESRMMKTVQWFGTKDERRLREGWDIRVKESAVPLVTDPQDVVLRVTSTCICGSDLHLYTNAMPGLKAGDILGHEFMGMVEVGPQVRTIQKGDRVVVSFDIGCGHCFYCNRQLFTSCDNTNPSKEQELMYGHRSGGFFGYTHMTGGWDGGQAEYSRVPFADLNCLKVPANLEDDQVVLLSDILPTAWHSCELGEVGEGDRVAIWGAGPVGLLAVHCAFVRGAKEVVLIDKEQDRLDFAHKRFDVGHNFRTINFKEQKPYDTMRQLWPDGTAPDVCIEAVGIHYTNSWLHWFEQALRLETDPSDTLNQLVTCCRKGGRIAIAGAYAGYANHFNIGAFMEKCLTMRAGQTPVQKYWKKLLAMIQSGTLEPHFVITHHPPLDQAEEAYRMFNDKEGGCIKVVMKAGATESSTKPAAA